MDPATTRLRVRDYLRFVVAVTLAHVVTYLAAGTLAYLGAALCPFLGTLAGRRLRDRFLVLLGLLLVFSVWSVTMPGSGSIEGWVYLKPDSGPTLPNPLLGHIEVPMQLAVFSFLVAWRIGKQRMRHGHV